MNDLNVLYQDSSLIVIDKPPGLVVDPSSTQQSLTLADILISDFKIKLERGGIVHRLDKDTSGVILVAKTKDALEKLQAQFKNRVVKKEYLSLVHGFLESRVVEGAIARNPRSREKFAILDEGSPRFAGEAGKEAKTEFVPIKLMVMGSEFIEKIFSDFNKIQIKKLKTMNYELYTLVNCLPLTGRTHQIRVHLKYINHPVVSDDKYAGRKIVRLDHRWCPRQFLHAARLGFKHPVSDKWMEFESPLPEDLEKVLWTTFSYNLL